MQYLLYAVIALAYLGIGACNVFFYWAVYFRPEMFREPLRYSSYGGWQGLIFIPVYIGTGICIYHGALACLSWIPEGWDFASYGSATSAETLSMIFAGNAGWIFPLGAANMAIKFTNLNDQLEDLRARGKA
ncbi:hypothetical protein [Rhodopseudomonas sp. RCAM05734]|uniref:hypothetical protein n=1 Tax=Rhodopseudomonas sp. RCAM05734 TaxID=3457549 RepID=UPI0040445F25